MRRILVLSLSALLVAGGASGASGAPAPDPVRPGITLDSQDAGKRLGAEHQKAAKAAPGDRLGMKAPKALGAGKASEKKEALKPDEVKAQKGASEKKDLLDSGEAKAQKRAAKSEK